jgi:hypothetical protein
MQDNPVGAVVDLFDEQWVVESGRERRGGGLATVQSSQGIHTASRVKNLTQIAEIGQSRNSSKIIIKTGIGLGQRLQYTAAAVGERIPRFYF